MKAIVAVDAHWGIGKNNDLLFSLPTDMKHFRKQTLDKVVVMGHSTLRSFPGEKPLLQRTNVVLSRNQELEIPGATICHSLEELTLFLQQFDPGDIMVVGGQTIYQQLLDFCSEIYVTRVQATRPADSFFPNLDQLPNWELSHTSPLYTQDDEDFYIATYRNNQVKTLESVFTPVSLTVRGTTFGTGAPKICMPLTSPQLSGLIRECEQALIAGADLVEWRADFFPQGTEPTAIVEVLKELRAALGHLPLLFTLRSKSQGGQSQCTDAQYKTALQSAISTGLVDFVDIEYPKEPALREQLIKDAQNAKVRTILSYHNHSTTPSQKELVERFSQMEALGADLPKIAVYPNHTADVLTLLAASEEYQRFATVPFVAISMSWLGSISRISGEFFGSAITFGAGIHSSAPGQLDAVVLRHLQRALSPPEPEGLP